MGIFNRSSDSHEREVQQWCEQMLVGIGVPSTDAANMAAATGIPALFWVVIWIGISLVMLTVGLRLYAVSRGALAKDSLFEE